MAVAPLHIRVDIYWGGGEFVRFDLEIFSGVSIFLILCVFGIFWC